MSKDKLLTRDFGLVWLSHFFQQLSWALFVHLPSFLHDLGMSEAKIGLIFGVSAFAAVVVRPVIGPMLDRLGRTAMIHSGNVLNVASIFLHLTVTGITPWLYVIRILHGVALAIAMSAFFTYGADVVPQSRRTQGLALFGVSGLLALALAGVIGDVILKVASFRELVIVAGAFAGLGLLMSLSLPERGPERPYNTKPSTFLSIIRHQALGPLWFMASGLAFVVAAYLTFLRTFVDDIGIGTVGRFFGAFGVTAILLRVLFGSLPDRIGPKRVLYPAIGSLSIGMLVLASSSSSTDLAVAGFFCGIGIGFSYPIIFGMIISRAPVTGRGSATSVFTALNDVGVFVGGPILGVIVTSFGYPSMFRFAVVTLVIVTLGFAFWDRLVVSDPDQRQATPLG